MQDLDPCIRESSELKVRVTIFLDCLWSMFVDYYNTCHFSSYGRVAVEFCIFIATTPSPIVIMYSAMHIPTKSKFPSLIATTNISSAFLIEVLLAMMTRLWHCGIKKDVSHKSQVCLQLSTYNRTV